jgi:hypothetical protein
MPQQQRLGLQDTVGQWTLTDRVRLGCAEPEQTQHALGDEVGGLRVVAVRFVTQQLPETKQCAAGHSEGEGGIIEVKPACVDAGPDVAQRARGQTALA